MHLTTSSLAGCKAEGKLPVHGCWSSCFLVQRRSGRRFGTEVQPSRANEALGWRSSWRMARSWTCSPGSPRRHWPETQKDWSSLTPPSSWGLDKLFSGERRAGSSELPPSFGPQSMSQSLASVLLERIIQLSGKCMKILKSTPILKQAGEGNGNPVQCSCPENPQGQGSLADHSPWGLQESNMPERLTLSLRKQLGLWQLYMT